MNCELCRGQYDCPSCYEDPTLDVVDDIVLAITSGEVEHVDELGDYVIPAAKDAVLEGESFDMVLDDIWAELRSRDEYKTLNNN